MTRRASALALALALVAASGVTHLALGQDAPSLAYVDRDGITHGTITIVKFEDPFAAADPNQPPREGERYVGVTVAFEAAADQSFDTRPQHILLQDTVGRIFYQGYIPREADPMLPDVQAQVLAPGNRISGLIGYNVPLDSKIDRIVFMPLGDLMVTIVDLVPGPGPAVGVDHLFEDTDGSQATITLTMADPFTEFDPAAPPPSGERYVMLTAVFQNSESIPYRVDPYQVWLRDASGNLIQAGYIGLPQGAAIPFLEAQNTAPGDRVSGYIGYAVPVDAQIVEIQYWRTTTLVVLLADLTGGVAPSPAPVTPAPAEPTPAPATPAPVEPTSAPPASITPDPSAGTGR